MSTKNIKKLIFNAAILLIVAAANSACTRESLASEKPDTTNSIPLNRILFVGDSFTHGRYAPLRTYNSAGLNESKIGTPLVFDENYGQTGARKELENGPWGGIPGIFAELASEAGLNYDVHIEAISATSLENNFAAASDVIAQAKWNAVVLQELSLKPLPYELTGSKLSNPTAFSNSVQTIEQAIHSVKSSAKVYLYEPWARADLAKTLSGGDASAADFNSKYAANLSTLANANHAAYVNAAQQDGNISGIAFTGDAWVNAWATNIANSNPYTGSSNLPNLWYGIKDVNDPSISNPDELHPSVFGAYLSGLVLFQKITGVDVRTFGGQEKAAVQLGIPALVATQLQLVAWQTVTK